MVSFLHREILTNEIAIKMKLGEAMCILGKRVALDIMLQGSTGGFRNGFNAGVTIVLYSLFISDIVYQNDDLDFGSCGYTSLLTVVKDCR